MIAPNKIKIMAGCDSQQSDHPADYMCIGPKQMVEAWWAAGGGAMDGKETRRQTQGKIAATKHWLSQAEEHFGKEAPIRGQMDLLLAEAELRSTRETCRRRNGSWHSRLFRHSIAFGLAAILVLAGTGGALWWWRDDGSTPNLRQPVTGSVVPAASVEPAPVTQISAAAVAKTETPSPAVVETKSSVQEVKTEQQPAGRAPAAAVLSPEEMNRLIQTAGQTLRGRTKQ